MLSSIQSSSASTKQPEKEGGPGVFRLLKTDSRFLLGISALALLLRLIYLFQSQSNPFFEAPIVDAQTFLEQARQIAAGDWLAGGEPFWQPPFYPYFIALLYALFPQHYFIAIHLVQSLMGTGCCILVYLLAHRATADGKVARLASGLAATYSVLIYFEGELLAVTLETFLYLLLLCIQILALETRRRRYWIGIGLLGGLAAITRPNILLFIAAFMIYLAWNERAGHTPIRAKVPLKKWGLIALPLCLVIFPVTLRNHLIGEDWVLISANGGVNFYIGNNAHYDSTVAIHPGLHWERLVGEPLQAGYQAPSARSRYFFAKAFSFIAASPFDYAKLLLKKLYLFWSGPEIKRNQDIYYARQHSSLLRLSLWERGIAFPFGLLGPLAILGMALAWRRQNPPTTLLILYVFAYGLSVILFFVSARYRVPALPVLLIFAAWALIYFWQRARLRSYGRMALWGTGFAALLLVLNLRTASVPEQDAQLYHDLGEVYLRKQDYSRSAAHSRRALELEETYPSAHHNLAVAYLHQRRYPEAMVHAGRGLELQPLNPGTMVVLAQAHLALGRWNEAEQQLQRALELEPELERARYQYGRLRLKQGRYREALPHLRAASRWSPDDFWVHYELAQAYRGAGQAQRALEFFRRAHLVDPQRPEGLNAMGAMHLLMAAPDRARIHFEQALDLDPGNPEALTNLGFVALQARRFPAAIQYLQQALSRATNPEPVYRGLVQAYLESGQRERAQEITSRWKDRIPAPSGKNSGAQ